MDFGLPIIGLRVDDNTVYVEHKKTGWLAPPPVKDRDKTVESLAQGIAYFLESETLFASFHSQDAPFSAR